MSTRKRGNSKPRPKTDLEGFGSSDADLAGTEALDSGGGFSDDGGNDMDLSGYQRPDKVPEHDVPQDLRTLRDLIQADQARFQSATDSEYWFCVSFENRAQKEAFLRAMGWLEFGDKYLDGNELAEKHKIDLPEAQVPYITEKPDAALNSISLPLKKK